MDRVTEQESERGVIVKRYSRTHPTPTHQSLSFVGADTQRDKTQLCVWGKSLSRSPLVCSGSRLRNEPLPFLKSAVSPRVNIVTTFQMGLLMHTHKEEHVSHNNFVK